MADSDFTGFDFAVGSVFGNRAWLVDAGGNLRGVTFRRQKWTPGVNVAECKTLDCDCAACLRVRSMSPFCGPEVTGTPGDGTHLAKHRCGFYAYFTGFQNDYTPKAMLSQAVGVIEGFGETVLGSKGFRSQKARIVALHLPPVSPSLGLGLIRAGIYADFVGGADYSARYQRVRDKYPDVKFYDDAGEMYRAHPASLAPELHIEPEQDAHYPSEWASGE